MSLHEYIMSRRLAAEDYPFYALIMAAMRQADTPNGEKLKAMWPELYEEMKDRYNAPGGALDENEMQALERWFSDETSE